MQNLNISDLFIYPIKSTKGLSVNSVNVINTGFLMDRSLAIINSKNEILTARECPKLLSISSTFNNAILSLSNKHTENLNIDLNTLEICSIEISLFNKKTKGKLFQNPQINNWFSHLLEEPCKLVKIDSENLRNCDSNTIENPISFNDCFPIHLTTTASVKDLNNKLGTKIEDNRYRPNIVISGTKPYEEETWKHITIGTCEFEVIMPTERCSLITINPITFERNLQQEPLRTLAKNRRDTKKVNFGIYLIPKNNGNLTKGDLITITR